MNLKKFALVLLVGGALILAACQPTADLPITGETEEPAAETPVVTLPPTEAATETPAATPTSVAQTPASTVTPTVTGTLAVTETPAVTPTPLLGDPETVDELVEALEDSGAQVERAGTIDQPIFDVDTQLLRVNGQDVQVFQFEDETARETASDLIEANGFIIGTMAVDWIEQPNFWAAGRLIVLYVGEDQDQIDLLSRVLGTPLTGRDMFLPPAAALEAQRFLADTLGVSIEEVEILSQEQVEWPNACLGLDQPGEVCAQVITPGWRILLNVNGQQYEVRTDEQGTSVRLNQ